MKGTQMKEHTTETNTKTKETSGIWALLIFVVMIGSIIMLSVFSQ